MSLTQPVNGWPHLVHVLKLVPQTASTDPIVKPLRTQDRCWIINDDIL